MRFVCLFLAVFLVLVGPKADAQESDANTLFRGALETYAAAMAAEGAERRALLQDVDAKLTQIREAHPNSIPAQFMAEGKPLGPIDMALVAEATKPRAIDGLPSDLANILQRTAEDVCDASDCTDAIATGLATFFLEDVFTNWDRAIDVEKVKWLFSNPGQLGGNLERVTLFNEIIEDPDVLSGLENRIQSSLVADMAKGAAREIGLSLLTNVAAEATARQLETSGRQDEADLVRRWAEPSVEISRTLIASGSATLPSAGAAATVIWAKNVYSLMELGQKTLEAEAAGATKEQQLAKLASDIDSLQRSLLTGKTTGPLFGDDQGITVTPRMARVFQDTLEDSYELQTYWLASDDVILLEVFDPVIQLAKGAARVWNDLQDEDETGQRTDALPADLAGADIAPDGFLGPDLGTPVASEPIASWSVAKGVTVLEKNVAQLDTVLRSDNSIWAFGRQALPPLNPSQTSFANVTSSPDGKYRVITQTVTTTQGWDARMALVPQDPDRPVFALAPGDVFRFTGSVAFLSDGTFALVQYNFAEFQSYALLVDLRDGRRGRILSDRRFETPAPYSNSDVWTARALGPKTHAITFRHLSCPADEPNCGMASFEDGGTTEVRFQLPEASEPSALPTSTSAPEAGQIALFYALEDGLYGLGQEACAKDPASLGDAFGSLFKSVTKPEYSVGYETVCTASDLAESAGFLRIGADCSAEGEPYKAQHLWKITGPNSFTDLGAQGGARDYVLCKPIKVERPAGPGEEWTSAIVLDPRDYSLECLSKPDIACLRAAGAPEEAIRFIEARGSEGGAGPIVPTGFKETGQVDVAYLNVFNAAGTQIPYFVNTLPNSITYPSFPERDLKTLAARGNRTAQSILRQYPQADSYHLFLGGMRKLPNGHQRFSMITPWTEMCRACPFVGFNLANVDFDQNGRIRASRRYGILDVRPVGGKFRFEVQDLRRHPSLVQYMLNVRGYDAGSMDGAIGPKTRTALSEFQRENGVNAGTGQLDSATYAALADRNTLFKNGTDPSAVIRAPHEAPAGQKWLQVASRDTLYAAEQIANGLAPRNPDISIFQANNSWFVVVAGLVSDNQAAQLPQIIRARGLPSDSLLSQGTTYAKKMAYKPPYIDPAHACSRPGASLSKSEILSLFENSALDTREGAGRYVVRTYGTYDRARSVGTASSTTNYGGTWKTFDEVYRVSDGQICKRFTDRTRWFCEYVKRCDPDGKGEGKRLVLLTDNDQISVTFDFQDGRPTDGRIETPKELYDRIDGDALSAKLIAATKYKNSDDEVALLKDMAKITGSDFRRLGDLEKMSILTTILHRIEKRAGVPEGSLEKLNFARNGRGGPHPTRDEVLANRNVWKLEPKNDFHVIGISNPARVEKYIRADGPEAVFYNDPQTGWRIMADGVNDATFNLVPNVDPGRLGFVNDNYQHTVLDILPWIIWGATPEDTTSLPQRLALYENSWLYKNLAQKGLPLLSLQLPDGDPVTTNDASAKVDIRTASAPQLAALLRAHGVTAKNVSFVSGNQAAQRREMAEHIAAFKADPPLVVTPDLPVKAGYDSGRGVMSACIAKDVLFPTDMLMGGESFGARRAASFVIAPSDPITGLGALPALCSIDMSKIKSVEAMHGKGELERFGLTSPRGLFVRFRMSADDAAAFLPALQNGSARVGVNCEMRTMIRKPYQSVPYDYERVGTCVPKTMTLRAIDFETGDQKAMTFSAGGKVYQPTSRVVSMTTPKPAPAPSAEAESERAKWSFQTKGSGEGAVREIVESFEGTTAEIILGYENAYPFQSAPAKKLAVRVFQALPENEVATRKGTEMGYGSFVIKSWSKLNAHYFVDDPKSGMANAVVGKIDGIRILSVRELAASSCEWSVTYRIWLRDLTPFGEALEATNDGDGHTFETCFRTTRDGYDIESYRYVDG